MDIKHYGQKTTETIPTALQSYLSSLDIYKFLQNGKLVLVFEVGFQAGVVDIEIFTQNQKYVNISQDSPKASSISVKKRVRAEIDIADLTWSADIQFKAKVKYEYETDSNNYDFVRTPDTTPTYYTYAYYIDNLYTLTLPLNVDITVNTLNITDHDIYYNTGNLDGFKRMRNDFEMVNSDWSKIDTDTSITSSINLAQLEDLNLCLMPKDKTDVEAYWNYGTTGSRVYRIDNICDKLFPAGNIDNVDFKIEIDSISFESNDKIDDFKIVWTRDTDISTSFDTEASAGYNLEGNYYFTTKQPRVNMHISTLDGGRFNFPESNGYIQRDGLRYPSKMYAKMGDTGTLKSFIGSMFGIDNDTIFFDFGVDMPITARRLESTFFVGLSRYFVEKANSTEHLNTALMTGVDNRYAPVCVSATRTAENTLVLTFDDEVASGYGYNIRFEDRIIGIAEEELSVSDLMGLTW